MKSKSYILFSLLPYIDSYFRTAIGITPLLFLPFKMKLFFKCLVVVQFGLLHYQ